MLVTVVTEEQSVTKVINSVMMSVLVSVITEEKSFTLVTNSVRSSVLVTIVTDKQSVTISELFCEEFCAGNFSYRPAICYLSNEFCEGFCAGNCSYRRTIYVALVTNSVRGSVLVTVVTDEQSVTLVNNSVRSCSYR